MAPRSPGLRQTVRGQADQAVVLRGQAAAQPLERAARLLPGGIELVLGQLWLPRCWRSPGRRDEGIADAVRCARHRAHPARPQPLRERDPHPGSRAAGSRLGVGQPAGGRKQGFPGLPQARQAAVPDG